MERVALAFRHERKLELKRVMSIRERKQQYMQYLRLGIEDDDRISVKERGASFDLLNGRELDYDFVNQRWGALAVHALRGEEEFGSGYMVSQMHRIF